MGEELNVSIRQEKLLAAMGIQVWYRRGVVAPAVSGAHEPELASQGGPARPIEATVNPPTPTPSSQEHTPIEFIWWRGQHGLLLLEPMQSLDEKLKHDIVAAMDWRVSGSVGKSVSGHFRWPQLATSSGNPARAMAAFLETNGPEQLAWLIVAESLQADLTPLLPEGVPVRTLPASLHLAEQKKELWQALAR